MAAAAAGGADGWTCETCTYVNAPLMLYCEMCEMSRPEEGATFWRCDLCDEECTERRFHTEGTGPDSIEDLCPTCYRNNAGSGQMFAGVAFVEMCDRAVAAKRKPRSKPKPTKSKPKGTAARTKLKKKPNVKSASVPPRASASAGPSTDPTLAVSNVSKIPKQSASSAERPAPAATGRKRSRPRQGKSALEDSVTASASGAVGTASFAAATAAPEGSRRRGDLLRARERASAYAMGLDIAPSTGTSGPEASSFSSPSSSSSDDDADAGGSAEQGAGWDGPFAIARQMGRAARRERKARRRAARNGSSDGDQVSTDEPPLELEWTPYRGPRRAAAQHLPLPSLETLAVRCLVQNFDALVALGAVTHKVRSDIGAELCKHGALTSEALTVLMDETSMDPWVEGWSEVVLSDCAKVEEQAMLNMLKPPVPARLVRLQLKSCGRGFGSKAADALGPQCPKLASLQLHGCYRLYDVDVLGILRRSPALTSLALEHAAELTQTTLEALADGLLPRLTHLSLSGCPHLCVAPDDGTSTEVAMEQLARTEMKQLNKLDLSYNPTLSASTLSRILSHHGAELADLNLIGCTELTAATLLEIATHCTEHLSCLKFAHAPPSRTVAATPDPNEEQQAIAMLHDSVTTLVLKCGASLQTLALEGCGPLLSDAALATVAKYCGEGAPLQYLSLNNASAISDRTLVALAEHVAGGLQALDLSWCRKLTDEGLGHLTDRCDRLKSLKLWGCSQLTPVFLNGHRRHALTVEGRPSRPPLSPAE